MDFLDRRPGCPGSGNQDAISIDGNLLHRLLGKLIASRFWPPPPATRHSPLATTSYDFPHQLLPSTDHRISKDRTGPDLDERSHYSQYATKPGDPSGKINQFSSGDTI